MTTSRHRWPGRLIPCVGFSIITLSALQVIGLPVTASAASPPGQAATSARPAAKGGENPTHLTHYGRDDSRSAVPSVMREYRKPPKQGDPIVTLGGQPPTYRKSPRITLPKRSSQPSRMQTRSPGSPAAPGSLR